MFGDEEVLLTEDGYSGSVAGEGLKGGMEDMDDVLLSESGESEQKLLVSGGFTVDEGWGTGMMLGVTRDEGWGTGMMLGVTRDNRGLDSGVFGDSSPNRDRSVFLVFEELFSDGILVVSFSSTDRVLVANTFPMIGFPRVG